MATYSGKTVFGTDTAAPGRIINLVHPKITVLWRAVGYLDKQVPSGQGTIDAFPPFAFSVDMLQPPPKEVIDAPDIFFGIVSLFSDVDRNGRFDRLQHPDMPAHYARLDSVFKRSETAKSELRAVSRFVPKAVVAERLYLDAARNMILEEGGRLDTLWSVVEHNESDDAHAYLVEYQRILGNMDRWERFFAGRKKRSDLYVQRFPTPGFYMGYDIRYERVMVPLPGREAEFRARLKKAVVAMVDLSLACGQFYQKAVMDGRIDYPFQGYGQPGQDWMAGRSIQDLLLYLPSQGSVDSLLAAIPTGSFRISNADRFRQGYNLIRCDDQYICDVRAKSDSILVLLGTSDLYFNVPSTPSKNPFPSGPKAPAAPMDPGSLAFMQGKYVLNGSDTVTVAYRNGELWCDASDFGLVRVVPRDSLGFHSPVVAFQGVFTPGAGAGIPDRLIQYLGAEREVVLRVDTSVAGHIRDRIDRASGFPRVDLPDSLMARAEGKFDYRGDTLRVTPAGGDSLKVGIPGFSSMVFHAAGDSLFRCPWGEWTLEFQGWDGTRHARVVFGNGAAKIVVPVFNPTPSNVLKTDKEPAVMEWVSESRGSGRDEFRGLDGKLRYGCSQDGTFLRPGDGYVEAFSRTGANDSISLRQGGDQVVFRIPGLKGKTVFLELRQCAERTAKGKRIRVSLWGGSRPESAKLLYGDHHWMATDPAGIYWAADSVAVDADPYFLTLRQENTADAPFYNAFDGYRLGIRP